jgi:hypothetical protein
MTSSAPGGRRPGVALALTTPALHRQRFWTISRLKPEIEL